MQRLQDTIMMELLRLEEQKVLVVVGGILVEMKMEQLPLIQSYRMN